MGVRDDRISVTVHLADYSAFFYPCRLTFTSNIFMLPLRVLVLGSLVLRLCRGTGGRNKTL